jgi:hypothetical protein
MFARGLTITQSGVRPERTAAVRPMVDRPTDRLGIHVVMSQGLETKTALISDFDDSADRFGHPSDRFIDAFGGYCASMVVLLNTLAYLDPPEPLDDSNEIVYGLCVVAGTVGYPLFEELSSDPLAY